MRSHGRGFLRLAGAFAALAREHIVAKRKHHHEVLGMLPLVVSSGDPAYVEALLGAIGESQLLYMMVRFLPAVKHPAAQRTRDALRAGLPQTRRAFVTAQEKLWSNPHQLPAAVHVLGLLQEAADDELPSERPYRFDWDNLDLYRCAAVREAAAKRPWSAPHVLRACGGRHRRQA
jgi:hypothetical protein